MDKKKWKKIRASTLSHNRTKTSEKGQKEPISKSYWKTTIGFLYNLGVYGILVKTAPEGYLHASIPTMGVITIIVT